MKTYVDSKGVELKVGDKVILNRAWGYGDEVGDICYVSEFKHDGIIVESDSKEFTSPACKPGFFVKAHYVTKLEQLTPLQALGYKEGDVFETNEYSMTYDKGCIVRLEEDDESAVPMFRVLKGTKVQGLKDISGKLVSIWLPVLEKLPREKEFVPFTIAFTTLAEFEIMKSILWQKNKISESSFYDLDFAPDPEDVRTFMKSTYEAMNAHHEGWSSYKRGDK